MVQVCNRNAASVARQALDVVIPLAAKNNTTCDLVVTADEHTVYADPKRLQQFMHEFVRNSEDFGQRNAMGG